MTRARLKVFTLRLPHPDAALLALVARVDDMGISTFIRLAIEEAIERRKLDPDFQSRLARLRAVDDEAFQALRSRETHARADC